MTFNSVAQTFWIALVNYWDPPETHGGVMIIRIYGVACGTLAIIQVLKLIRHPKKQRQD